MNRITTDIPHGIPAPKFSLFQQVQYNGTPCTVVGLNWVSQLDAFAQQETEYGWQFNVSFLYGKTIEQALTAKESEHFVRERELQPI